MGEHHTQLRGRAPHTAGCWGGGGTHALNEAGLTPEALNPEPEISSDRHTIVGTLSPHTDSKERFQALGFSGVGFAVTVLDAERQHHILPPTHRSSFQSVCDKKKIQSTHCRHRFQLSTFRVTALDISEIVRAHSRHRCHPIPHTGDVNRECKRNQLCGSSKASLKQT